MGPGVPPSLKGVTASQVALPPGPWVCLLDFLSERFVHVPRDVWQARLLQGRVFDERGQAFAVDAAYQPHQRIHYYREVDDEAIVEEAGQVLYQDDHLLVLDKPHFLPVVPSGRYLHQTALIRLRQSLGRDEVAPIHRLDRETAGLVMFSLQTSTRSAYHGLFREHRVHKVYEAVAPWKPGLQWPQVRTSRLGPGPHFMQQAEHPGASNSHTRIDCIAHDADWALYRLEPRTGQRHQLRVHLAALGLPIRHDRIYPTLLPAAAEDRSRPLQLLARSLSFTDPLSGREHHFESARRLAHGPAINAHGPSR